MGKANNPLNPTLDYFGGGSSARLAAANPLYYQWLTDPQGFDYTKAPTGAQEVVLPGKGNDFAIDWNSIVAPLKREAEAKAALEAEKAAAKTKAEADATAAAAKRAGDISTARGYAVNEANDLIRGWGLDPAAYQEQVGSALDRIITGLGSTADPYSAITGAVANDILNTAQNSARAEKTKAVDAAIGSNYGDNLISDNALDSIINDILTEQRGGAQEYLDRGKARGIYNDVGYNAGLKAIDSGASAGLSQLGSLAGDVINKYEGQANSIRDKAYRAASGYTLGRDFNLDDYIGQGNKIAENFGQYGAGDLRNAFGGTQLFDFSDLTGAAGQAQGAQNLGDTDVTTALANRKKANAQGRGLGSVGVF